MYGSGNEIFFDINCTNADGDIANCSYISTNCSHPNEVEVVCRGNCYYSYSNCLNVFEH